MELRTKLLYAISDEAYAAVSKDINQAITDGALQATISAHYPLTETAKARDAVDSVQLISKAIIDISYEAHKSYLQSLSDVASTQSKSLSIAIKTKSVLVLTIKISAPLIGSGFVSELVSSTTFSHHSYESL